MSRTRVVVLAVTFACSFMLVIAGCGGSGGGGDDEAKALVRSADLKYQAARAIGDEVDAARGAILQDAQNNNAAGLIAREAEIQSLLKKVKQATVDLNGAADDYLKVRSTGGSQQYKEYAKLKLELIGKEKDAVTLGQNAAEGLQMIIQDLKAGKPYDLPALVQASSATIQKIDNYHTEILKLEQTAEEYARKNNLL